MEITAIKIFDAGGKKVKAFATIVLDNCFVIRDIKVVDGVDRLFVAMPSKRLKDGSHRDVVHPMTSTMRKTIESSILQAYREMVNDK